MCALQELILTVSGRARTLSGIGLFRNCWLIICVWWSGWGWRKAMIDKRSAAVGQNFLCVLETGIPLGSAQRSWPSSCPGARLHLKPAELDIVGVTTWYWFWRHKGVVESSWSQTPCVRVQVPTKSPWKAVGEASVAMETPQYWKCQDFRMSTKDRCWSEWIQATREAVCPVDVRIEAVRLPEPSGIWKITLWLSPLCWTLSCRIWVLLWCSCFYALVLPFWNKNV